jgi:hypothetical protein
MERVIPFIPRVYKQRLNCTHHRHAEWLEHLEARQLKFLMLDFKKSLTLISEIKNV